MIASRPTLLRSVLALCGAISAAAVATADDWVHWRGPEETGVARGQNLPDKFDVKEPGKNGLIWKLPIGGRNAPLVLKGRIYILDGYDQKLPTEGERVICLDEATGKTLWEQRFNVFLADIDSSRVGWATLTADPEHERIYAHSSAGTMFCFDRDGKIVWKREMTEEYGVRRGDRRSGLVVGRDDPGQGDARLGAGDCDDQRRATPDRRRR
jgi:outer membrane protein assembly factor BamB